MYIYIKGKNEISCIIHTYGCNMRVHDEHTDNQCEWYALVDALEYISGMYYVSGYQETSYRIYTDSVLLYKQINGEYRIKNKELKAIYFKWNNLKNILQDLDIKYYYVCGIENPVRLLL